jgi:hypothetical protein
MTGRLTVTCSPITLANRIRTLINSGQIKVSQKKATNKNGKASHKECRVIFPLFEWTC